MVKKAVEHAPPTHGLLGTCPSQPAITLTGLAQTLGSVSAFLVAPIWIISRQGSADLLLKVRGLSL